MSNSDTTKPKSNSKRIFTIIVAGFIAYSTWQAIVLRYVPVIITPAMIINQIEHPTERLHKTWVPLSRISPNMAYAVISSEDNLFFSHYGFDFTSIKKAIRFNERKHGRKIRGGSTISQQTAKNVFLTHHRSYIRKAFEAYYTVLIERVWGKERILEVYLNVVEVGKSIYGVEAGAQEHFHRSATRLSRGQAARLAAVLPAPRKFNASRPSRYVMHRQNLIQSLMYKVPRIPLYDK